MCSLFDAYAQYYHSTYYSKILESHPSKACLELACGDGKYSSPIVNHFNNVSLSDISPQAVSFARKRFSESTNCNYLVFDISRDTLTQQFDVLAIASSLSYVSTDEFTKCLSNVLSRDGKLVFIDSFNDSLLFRHYRNLLLILRPAYRDSLTNSRMPRRSSLANVSSYFSSSEYYQVGRAAPLVFLLSLMLRIQIKNPCRLLPLWRFLDSICFLFPPYKTVGVFSGFKTTSRYLSTSLGS